MSRHAGFTLVELLASAVIIALLMAAAIPAFSTFRLRAWQVMSSNNLRQITTANLAYAADTGSFVPADDWWNNRRWCGSRSSKTAPYDPTKGLLSDYIDKSRRVTPCPLFTHLLARQGKVSTFEEGSGGYGYNDYISGGIAPNYTNDTQRLRISRLATRLPRPSRTIMFATTALAQAGGVQEYPFCHPPYWTNENGDPEPFYGRPTPSLHFRFAGRALVSWCDGHLSAESLEPRTVGYNPYGGDADSQNLGWFGPDEGNGYWNPDYTP